MSLHPLGTARIAQLGLARGRLVACAQWADRSALAARLPPQTALLYPAAGARDLSSFAPDEPPRHLVLIDGTWFHAKKIYDAQPWLRDLPPVRLAPGEPSRYRGFRREPRALYVATGEAIVYARRVLEPGTRGLDGLVPSFTARVARQAHDTPHRRRAGGVA